MSKKVASIFVVVLMIFVFATPVYASEADDDADTATETEYHHVLDFEGLLSEEKSQSIEEAANAILENNGVDLFAYVTGDEISELKETGNSIYSTYSTTDASVVMMIDSKGAYIKAYGRASSIFTKEELSAILKKSKKQEGRDAKLLKFVNLTGKALNEKGVLPIPQGRLLPRLVDDAELLSQEERYALVKKLDDLSDKWQIDIVVVTNNSLEGKSVEAYADDFFDYNGYGYGDNSDGIMFLISMDTREWAISTNGTAIDIFTDDVQQEINEDVVSYLREGDYLGAFTRFADLCDSTIEEFVSYAVSDSDKSSSGGFMSFVISVVSGLVVGFIVAMVLRGQLTSVKPQTMATAYAKKGSMKITERTDLFLYHQITRVAKPKDSDSSSGHSGGHSGSSVHTSSSGRSHGGSHGHF